MTLYIIRLLTELGISMLLLLHFLLETFTCSEDNYKASKVDSIENEGKNGLTM